MKNEKGITLVVLLTTVIILIIIASVSIVATTNHLDSIRLKSFYTKLEIAREEVEKISRTNEKYKDENNSEITVKNQGTQPTVEQLQFIESLGYNNSSNFKYFTADQVKNILGIQGVDLNLLIDFDNNVLINPEGITVKGVSYYTLNNSKYHVTFDESSSIGNPSFTYTVANYGNNSYKITVTPVNVGNIKEGIVKYKKSSGDYWIVAENYDIIVNSLTSYVIMYIDAHGNSATKTILLSLDASNNVIATEQ